MATSFDFGLGSSSSHSKECEYIEKPKTLKLQTSNLYINNILKMYVKYTKVKSVTFLMYF